MSNDSIVNVADWAHTLRRRLPSDLKEKFETEFGVELVDERDAVTKSDPSEWIVLKAGTEVARGELERGREHGLRSAMYAVLRLEGDERTSEALGLVPSEAPPAAVSVVEESPIFESEEDEDEG